MIKATELTEKLDAVMNEMFLIPVNVSRKGGSAWTVTNTNSKATLETFNSYDKLKEFLQSIVAAAVPDDILNQNEVNTDIPCMAARIEYVGKHPKGEKEDVITKKIH
jgi:hypothetical protein